MEQTMFRAFPDVKKPYLSFISILISYVQHSIKLESPRYQILLLLLLLLLHSNPYSKIKEAPRKQLEIKLDKDMTIEVFRRKGTTEKFILLTSLRPGVCNASSIQHVSTNNGIGDR